MSSLAASGSEFRLVLLSPPETTAAELTTLPQLFEAGLQTFHLRKPGASAAEVAAYLRAVPPTYHSRIVLHAHYELTQAYPLRGLHLPARARPTWAAQAHWQQAGHTLSTSFHSVAELRGHRRPYDYVFLSPVFDSISKPGYGQAFAPEAVRKELQRLHQRGHYVPRVVALGGVTAANVARVRAAGFAGAAVLGSVWQAPDPVAALRQLL